MSQSILSFPERGQWGDAKWPGNCSGYVYQSLFTQLNVRSFADPMVGSGTSVEVARSMGIEAFGFDLHSGFSVLRDSILAAVGRPVDFVFSHPPYGDMIKYSGHVYGDTPHADDLSHCDEVTFLERLHVALLNQREATRGGGVYGMLIGDMRRNGQYHSYQAEMIARLPKCELRAVLIKAQHNVTSGKRDYRLRFPRIMHEYILLWERPTRPMAFIDAVREMVVAWRARLDSTWRTVVHHCMVQLGGQASLTDLYAYVAKCAEEKLANNPHWKAKVRQVLNTNTTVFLALGRGRWALA